MKEQLRVLVLCHPNGVPPATMEGLSEKEIDFYKTEYDVITTLTDLGHEVRVLGVQYDLKPIREGLYVRDLKPSKLRLVVLWNEHSRREPIRFAFESFCLNVCGWIGDSKAVNEDTLFPMERNVCRFMEEAEPEDVLPVITEAELKQCLG